MKVITKTYRWEKSAGYERKFAIRTRKFCGNYVVESFIRLPLYKPAPNGKTVLEAHPHLLYKGPNKEKAEEIISAQKDEMYYGKILHNGLPSITKITNNNE